MLSYPSHTSSEYSKEYDLIVRILQKVKTTVRKLDSLEQMLVLAAAAGSTGWHYMIYRDSSYAPHLSDYSRAAGGRTFPSPAGWHVVDFFYTDDSGEYFFPTRGSVPVRAQ